MTANIEANFIRHLQEISIWAQVYSKLALTALYLERLEGGQGNRSWIT